MSATRESKIEEAIGKEVARLNGLYLKFRPTENGYPDRVVLLPGKRIMFLEIKRVGEGASELQIHRMKAIEARGFKCYCVNTITIAKHLISQLSTGV